MTPRILEANTVKKRPDGFLSLPLWQTIDITMHDECHRLHEGDCQALELDSPKMFYNPTRKTVRYAVVVATDTRKKR